MIILILMFLAIIILGVLSDFDFFIFLGIVGIVFTFTIFILKNSSTIEYKVRELEKNTVFTITDSSALYQDLDTVWINMKTKKIDPNDSTAMKCVILKNK